MEGFYEGGDSQSLPMRFTKDGQSLSKTDFMITPTGFLRKPLRTYSFTKRARGEITSVGFVMERWGGRGGFRYVVGKRG